MKPNLTSECLLESNAYNHTKLKCIYKSQLPFVCLSNSGRLNRTGMGSGSAKLSGSVRFGGSAEPRGSVNRTKTEPKHCINPIFY